MLALNQYLKCQNNMKGLHNSESKLKKKKKKIEIFVHCQEI